MEMALNRENGSKKQDSFLKVICFYGKKFCIAKQLKQNCIEIAIALASHKLYFILFTKSEHKIKLKQQNI